MRRVVTIRDFNRSFCVGKSYLSSKRNVRMPANAGAPRHLRTDEELHTIVVVGAGFAGLAAAKTLEEQSKARVTLVEASQAVGGRAKSALLSDGQKVELGATWLHGSKGHPVYELALAYGLMTPSDLSDSKSFWKGSRYFREDEAEALVQEEEKLAKSTIASYAEAMEAAEERKDITVASEHLEPQFEKLYRQRRPGSRDAEIVRDAWNWRELLQRNIDGSDHTSDSAVDGLAEYEDLPGHWGPIPGGYQTVAQRMADDLSDVRCGWVVEQIEWGNEGVSVHSQNGETLHADAVVLTVSLGVLKEKHEQLFQPPLPEEKVAAIQRLGIGVVDKVFVTFIPDPDSPPPQPINSYNLLWSANAKELLPGDKQVPESSAIERCFDAGSQALPAQSEPWHKGMYSFRFGGSEFIRGSTTLLDSSQIEENVENVAQEDGKQTDRHDAHKSTSRPPPLSAVAWIASHHAVNMEHASGAQLVEGINATLDAFPGLQMPRSFKVVRSNWGDDPFSRGSYSYVSAQASLQDVDRLAEPLADSASSTPRVVFAGEALSKAHMGTTTGAFLTGRQEAERLVAALGIEKAR